MTSTTHDMQLLATVAAVRSAVADWKFRPFRTDDIPYSSAVYSLNTDSPLVELRRTGGNEWTVGVIGFCVVPVRR